MADQPEPLLVADIGGTHARFAIARGDALESTAVLDVASFEGPVEAARAFLSDIGESPQAGCFAVAAPVTGDEIAFTNSPWSFGAQSLRAALGLERLRVMNDFVALASGIAVMPSDAFELVHEGSSDPAAPRLVMGPGTGLGQALIVPCQQELHIVATQGGHTAFAPRTDEEIEVLRRLKRDFGRVSLERILTGGGIVNLYRALGDVEGGAGPLEEAHAITASAADGSDDLAAKTMALFFAILGRAAANAVIGTGARGGVVLGGGILLKVKELFLRSDFVAAFLDAGRMQEYVADAPISLLLRKDAALVGAAREGARLCV